MSGCEIAPVLGPSRTNQTIALSAPIGGVACVYRPIAKTSSRARILTGFEGVLHVTGLTGCQPLAEPKAFELAFC